MKNQIRLKQLKECRDKMRRRMYDDKYLDENYISLSELAVDIIETQARIEELELTSKKSGSSGE